MMIDGFPQGTFLKNRPWTPETLLTAEPMVRPARWRGVDRLIMSPTARMKGGMKALNTVAMVRGAPFKKRAPAIE